MLPFQVAKLKQLPQHMDDVWQGGIVRLPGMVIDDDGKPFEPEVALWISLKAGKVGPAPENYQPGDTPLQTVLNALVAFANDPKLTGYRPGKVEVGDAALAEQLSSILTEVGIRVEQSDHLAGLLGLQDLLRGAIGQEPMIPGPLEDTGVTLDRFRDFATAAKGFFEAAPWRQLGNEDLIEIAVPKVDDALRCAVVLGAGGQEFGLGFYKSADHYWKTYECEQPGDLLKLGALWSLNFDALDDLPVADAELWQEERLPVCRDKMFPVLVRQELKGGPRRADAATLTYVEGLMRALAATTEEELDAGRWTKHVETFDGPVDYVLSLPFELQPPTPHERYRRGMMPDRRAMEAQTAEIHRFMEGKNFANIDEANAALEKEFSNKPVDRTKYPPRTPLEQAQDLCYQAFDAFGRRRLTLAREALKICPDCADAYVILAEASSDPAKAMGFFAQGVEAGRRAVGEARFKEDAGHFWGLQSTRPFMRALLGLAMVQTEANDLVGAVANYQELLRLNPNDNQGARDQLLPLLLQIGQDEAAAKLLAAYEDDASALWSYGRALLTFRQEGDTERSRELLGEAIGTNRHVPKYLLDRDSDGFWPDSYAVGSNEEAIICADQCGEAWDATPGALVWLDQQARKIRKAARGQKGKPKGKKSSRKKRSR